MTNPTLINPLDEIKGSGKATQEAQNEAIKAGSAAAVALVRELLKNLKLPQKRVNVAIKVNDRPAYKASVNNEIGSIIDSQNSSLTKEQVEYLEAVIKFPSSKEIAATKIPLDKDVSITVNDVEIYSLKNGVVEKNLLVSQVQQNPQTSISQVQPSSKTPEKIPKMPIVQVEKDTDFNYFESETLFEEDLVAPEVEENQQKSISEVPLIQTTSMSLPKVELQPEVEIVNKPKNSDLKTGNVSLSDKQKEQLKQIGIDPQTVEEAIKQNQTSPIIIVVNRETSQRVQKPSLNKNLKNIGKTITTATKDLGKKISSAVSAIRERLFPQSNQNISKDIKSFAVVNVASELIDRYGSSPKQDGSEIFEGNAYRIERSGKNLSISAKDGRGNILNLKDGKLTSSLTKGDIDKFRVIDQQLGQFKTRAKDIEIER